MELSSILWREWVFFKKRWIKILLSQIITPLLYLITFGWGIGKMFDVDGVPYLFFIIPGVIGMSTMRTSYSYISTRVCIARLSEKSFENYLLSPTRLPLLVLSHLLAGAIRGFIPVICVILILSPFGAIMNVDLKFFVICFLNSIMFSSMGFAAAMIIDSHYDLNRVQSFLITPMSFLCGTFFSLSQLPIVLNYFIELLPLTHSIRLLRNIFLYDKFDGFSLIIMLVYIVFFYMISLKLCYEESRF